MFQRLINKIRAGMFIAAAQGVTAGGLTAAGTTYADALQLAVDTDVNVVTTAAASSGVKLSAPSGPGDEVVVFNRGANACLVYPQAGGQINALTATTAGFSVAAGGRAAFISYDGTNWMALLSA